MGIKTWTGGGCLLILTALLVSSACSDEPAPSSPGGAGAAGVPDSSGESGSGGESGSDAGAGGAAGAVAGDADPGALVHVTATSQVGVLLDEVPAAIRERVASALLAKPSSFYEARARRQLTLSTYRLNFRAAFYEEDSGKNQLPLPPPEVQAIHFQKHQGKLAYRATVEGHDYVLADYDLDATVVTDLESPGISEPALAEVGGTWQEDFVFPVDPELLVQRTGFACMDEAEFPPNSVDTEDVEFFYDQECDVEPELSTEGCHLTKLADMSCLDALSTSVGSVAVAMIFERVPWDAEAADAARVGKVETAAGADLAVVGEELEVNRLTYRYIDDKACSLAEKCVGGTGWRRLLQFNASEKNVGSQAVDIGDVNYYLDDTKNDNPNANHHVYEYSECHHHYHFNHFATFSYGGDPSLGSKRAFCLESVARYSNHEQSPTWSPYGSCAYQGISPGWGDQYNAGIECQWVDVTTIDTSAGPVTKPLGLESNPDQFLCEGTPVLDANGDQVWERTQFKTESGDTVDRPKCDFVKNAAANNHAELAVTLPVPGEGMITEPCTRGQLGPKRNCGYTYAAQLSSCTPGATVQLTCKSPNGAAPQALRICEGSSVLGAAVACAESDALAAALPTSEGVKVSFKCPEARDEHEPGGKYGLYYGAIWPEDETVPVTCVAD
ncbi:MAG TPA: lysyl oxidase family protein [Polyangiaceae bacterium]|nr:lysyl oxidase family protein [Polyangiaceae bacterium]